MDLSKDEGSDILSDIDTVPVKIRMLAVRMYAAFYLDGNKDTCWLPNLAEIE